MRSGGERPDWDCVVWCVVIVDGDERWDLRGRLVEGVLEGLN